MVRRQLEQPPPAWGTAFLLHQHPSVPAEPQVPAQMLQHPLHAHKKKRGALHPFLLDLRTKQCVTDGVSICEKVGTIFKAGCELVGLGRMAPIGLSISLKSFIAGKGVVLASGRAVGHRADSSHSSLIPSEAITFIRKPVGLWFKHISPFLRGIAFLLKRDYKNIQQIPIERYCKSGHSHSAAFYNLCGSFCCCFKIIISNKILWTKEMIKPSTGQTSSWQSSAGS